MTTSLPQSLSKRPLQLAVSKSLIVLLVAISLVLVETFSGALRFYLDQLGLAPLLYTPKAACLGLFALELLNYKGGRGFWFMLLLLAVAALLAMLHGATLNNVGFAFYMYSPFLFGVVCGTHLEHRKRWLALVVGLCLVASLVGIALDKYTAVPWKGYSYSVGDTQLTGNQTWSDNGVDRIAGFSRLSTTLSVMVAIYSLYLSAFTRSRMIMALLFAVSLVAIYFTTNKSTVMAFACTVMLMPFLRNRLLCRVIFSAVVAMGIALPIIGLTVDFDANSAAAQSGVLSSFYDRLINTWPDLVHNQWVQGWTLWGAGFGMVGSSVTAFPVMSASAPVVADNSALYLWATFGIAGVAVYSLVLPLLIQLREKTTRQARALVSICFCLTLVSWTTDIPEGSVGALFLGLSVAVALRRQAMPVNADIRQPARPPRQPAFATPFRTL